MVETFLGSAFTPLIYVEVFPLECPSYPESPSFTAASIKSQLLQFTLETTLSSNRTICVRWDEIGDSLPRLRSGHLVDMRKTRQDQEIISFAQHNVLIPYAWPCKCRVYTVHNPVETNKVLVTEATLVKVYPSRNHWKHQLIGEISEPRLNIELEVLQNQNPETIKELKLRMEMLLSDPILVGTTSDAILLHEQQQQRRIKMQRATMNSTTKEPTNQTKIPALLREGSLLIHSPDHAAGKTLLVHALAMRELSCHAVHIIRPGPLLAKYGIHADTALESIIHSIAVSMAVREQRICIILDQLESFLPPALSKSSGLGDATVPVLNAMAAYLKQLTQSVRKNHILPFPTKNPFYNLNGSGGAVLSVNLCLVGVVTCPDDGWRRQDGHTTIFRVMDTNLYRLPSLTASTRIQAFKNALEREHMVLSSALESGLPHLAASATWARGPVFSQIARSIQSQIKIDTPVPLKSFELLLASKGRSGESRCDVQFFDNRNDDSTLFGSIGGNNEAKIALEESLALDSKRRELLKSFGLSPPCGVLLYGPPGTGKTLLAKAIAKLLRKSQGGSAVGGAFVSMSITDVVLAEVGSGEKRVKEAFVTARMNAPSVVFIDEFQALFTDRSSGGSGRLTSTLIECMDDIHRWSNADKKIGLNENENKRIVILAATNTPWMVDKAFLRPGRFDRVVHVGLPDQHDRTSILRLLLSRMNMQLNNTSKAALTEKISNATEGFSGADLAALCRAAAIRSLIVRQEHVSEQEFFHVLDRGLHASSSTELVKQIREWRP